MRYVLAVREQLHSNASIFHTRITQFSPDSLHKWRWCKLQGQRCVPRERNYSIVAVYIVKNTKETGREKRHTPLPAGSYYGDLREKSSGMRQKRENVYIYFHAYMWIHIYIFRKITTSLSATGWVAGRSGIRPPDIYACFY